MASIGTLVTRIRHFGLGSTSRWSTQCAKPSTIEYDPASKIASVTSFSTRRYTPGIISSKSTASKTFSTNAEVITATKEDSDIPSDLVSAELMNLVFKNPKQKLRPRVVRKRIENLRVYEGKEKNIRGSPWKLNLVCQFAAGQTVPEALTQLMFVEKEKAPLVARVIQRTCNLASIRDGLLPCQVEVAECFSTHGTPLKRVRYHSKGRFGNMLRRFSHFNVKLREIDFDLKIAQSTTKGQMQRWILRKAEALLAVSEAKKEQSETDELERQYAALEEKKKIEEEEAAAKK